MGQGISWARASQFNWTFDNGGGTSLQEAICGAWSGVTFVVQDNNLRIPEVWGGGRVYFIRGVWPAETLFAWGGFWVEPEAGETNYYSGGSFVNRGNETLVSLGTPLPDGTVVQVYYIYQTGEKAKKYEALNSTPCIRRAWRSATDYTYDFAVDRIFDAMAAVYLGYRERGLEPTALLDFFWQTYVEHAASNGNPLVWDDFNRQWHDRGSYLLYADSTLGKAGLARFGTELPPAPSPGGRALRFQPAYYHGPRFSAWCGYGFNWDLSQPYFRTINRLRFKLRSAGAISHVQKFLKAAGTGTAPLIVQDGFILATVKYFQLTVTAGGPPGLAKVLVQRFGADMVPENEETVTSATALQPLDLGYGLKAYWLDGSLEVGDTWLLTCGNQEIRPHRLWVILNDSRPTDPEPFGEAHTYVHGLGDYYPDWQDFELDFSQFWRLGNLIDCRDRKPQAWGNWSVHQGVPGRPYEMLFYDVAEPETIDGKLFYTKQRFTWNLNPATLEALGFFVGIPDDVRSDSFGSLNYLIRQYTDRPLLVRTKVRDAQGNYFYHDDPVGQDRWVRVTIPLAAFWPERGGTLTHPLTLVDICLVDNPPAQGSFDLIDLKFDEHLTFPGQRLRVVEFKYTAGPVQVPVGPAYYLDDFGFDCAVNDPYPYVPRLAISLNAYGRNPWRGPTLVHYSHPLAPFLVRRFDLKTTFVAFHQEAQREWQRRYGGQQGPIMPVHTRNDLENIVLCGEENFNRFCWWSRYRDYGKSVGAWRFNNTLTDSEKGAELVMSSGSPVYSTGICQPGPTSLSLPGSGQHAYYSPGTDFLIHDQDFAVELVIKRNTTGAMTLVGVWNQVGNQRSWLVYLSSANRLIFGYSLDGINNTNLTSNITLTDTNWHHLVVTRVKGDVTFYLDGVAYSTFSLPAAFFAANAPLRIGSAQTSWPGYFNGLIDYVAVHVGRGMSASEVAGRWQIIQGTLNGSDYPEVGHGLGQYWAFYRLGEYFFVSNDAGAWDILTNWLDWFSTHLVADGAGWKFPVWFSEYGFTYGDYDPGAAASIAIGALYIYMRNGDSRALTLAQRILGDLRNRASGDYGGYLYKSDYHYAWMNALVAHAFGMAVVGRAGAAYRYPSTAADETHFRNMMANFWAMSGDAKPNLLNRDLIPYHACEAADLWDYAPHYLFLKEMGSMEGLVLMLHVATDWAKYTGSWQWFETLLAFMVQQTGAALGEDQVYGLSSHYLTSQMANRIGVTFGDFRRQPEHYIEVAEESLMAQVGEVRKIIPLHYGSPVVTEDVQTASKIAQRALQYYGTPLEMVRVVADLSAARVEVNDQVKITSRFHGLAAAPFTVVKREYDARKLRVSLDLLRGIIYCPSWAVDASGSAYDSFAIQTESGLDADWLHRAFAN